MTRIECNVLTGEVTEITLSPQEEAVALAQKAAWDASNTQDVRAARAVDAADRLNFEVNYDQESRLRVLEGKSPISKVVYRDALIVRWKVLNA